MDFRCLRFFFLSLCPVLCLCLQTKLGLFANSHPTEFHALIGPGDTCRTWHIRLADLKGGNLCAVSAAVFFAWKNRWAKKPPNTGSVLPWRKLSYNSVRSSDGKVIWARYPDTISEAFLDFFLPIEWQKLNVSERDLENQSVSHVWGNGIFV